MTAVDFAAFVDRLATVSGEAILPFFRTSLGIENKGGPGHFDPVTAADRAAETAMRTLIRQSFPEHGIIGEEFGNERPDAEFVWVLDPIDGTKSFIAGMPAWGTLIALTRKGEPVLRHDAPAVHPRALHRRRRCGALSRPGRRARAAVRPCARPARRDAVHDEPAADERRPTARPFEQVEDAVKLSRYGGDCYAYCMLAAGHVDLVIETELKPYDIAAADPDHRRRRRRRSRPGTAARPRPAAASSRPATSACTRRR